MRAKIFYHGGCFDGACSAALFAQFYRDCHPGADIGYQPMAHSLTDPFAGSILDGDDNACVDFRYCADPKMNWWFDHHLSAFQPREVRTHFEATASRQKTFDPAAPSCAGLIARSLERDFDYRFDGDAWSELLAWADKIDSASFKDAREAVELSAPALEIMTWLAHHEDSGHLNELIELLGKEPLGEIAAARWIAEPLAPIHADRARVAECVGMRARQNKGVVFYDLSADDVSVHNKFLGYLLFPEARYSVAITRARGQLKISVGSNPWATRPRTHDIAKICEQYGGGGHAVVGAVSIPNDDLERARTIARVICETLSSG